MLLKYKFCISFLLVFLSLGIKADNRELMMLAAQDQAERSSEQNEWNDDKRRFRVLELLASGDISTPRDKLNAALILQHTPATICDGKVKSLSPENYLLAHNLAKSAYNSGLENAKLMIAFTIDRYLSFTEGRQLYGTSKLIDLETGEVYFPKIDRTISDQERAEFGVQPIAELIKQAPERELEGK